MSHLLLEIFVLSLEIVFYSFLIFYEKKIKLALELELEN